MGLGAVTLVGCAVLVYLLISIHIDRRLIARMEYVAHTERARAHWAAARRELLGLVESGKISIESETFRTFYGLQTYIMRRPDAYAEFSRRLAAVMARAPQRSPRKSWQAELEEWPPEMEPVLRHMSQGVLALVMGYPAGRRLMVRLVLRAMPAFAPIVARHASAAVFRVLADLAKSIPGVKATHRMLAAQSKFDAMRGRIRHQPPAFA